MSNRPPSWFQALRDLKANRITRPAVREEPLRNAASFTGSASLRLSAWRGRSGRRYVVIVHDLDQPDLVAEHPTVVLAVTRDAEGRAGLLAVRSCPRRDPGFLGWLAACAQRGAREVHAHRLAEGEARRAGIASDLIDSVGTPSAGTPR